MFSLRHHVHSILSLLCILSLAGRFTMHAQGSGGSALQQGIRSHDHLLSTETLARSADIIAVGKISSVRSEWNADSTSISSRATLAVSEVIKGRISSASITIRYPGGEVGDQGEMYTHMPSFKPDEDVVVFATSDNQGSLKIVGGDKGKLTLTTDATTGTRMTAAGLTLETLRTEIRQYISKQQTE